jgi:hypothetical protein
MFEVMRDLENLNDFMESKIRSSECKIKAIDVLEEKDAVIIEVSND